MSHKNKSDVVDGLRMMATEFRKNADVHNGPIGTTLGKAYAGRALIAEAAGNEIEKLRNTIISALDCLHHDDADGARKVLARE